MLQSSGCKFDDVVLDEGAGRSSSAQPAMCRVPSFKPSQPQPRWFAVVPVLFLDFLVMALPGVDTYELPQPCRSGYAYRPPAYRM